ncbi:hypothetical protein [Streptomyces sp. NPDC058157]|uniref:terpene synthase family protein n=1 Tax=Streptomyces sp. NPDC058157 TaxID=3346360 RepID=UPI0036F1360E
MASCLHPQVEQIEERALRWLDGWDGFGVPGLRAAAERTRSAEFFARITPDAPAGRVQIAVEWTYWGFAFDDVFCDTMPWAVRTGRFARLSGLLVRMLECPGARVDGDGEVFLEALGDLSARFAEVCTAVQHRRWVAAQRAWLSGVVWQIGNRARGVMPDLGEYLAMRINSAAGEPVTAMVEMVQGPEVPAGDFDRPGVRACTEMARLVASLDNDLHSYAKDAARGETDQNIVNVLTTLNSYGPGTAVGEAVALRNRIMHRFIELRTALAPSVHPATRGYLEGLGRVVRGNLDWAAEVPRYQAPAPITPLQSTISADGPSQAGDPLPWPIAWWWGPALEDALP